jgi:cytidine deaminase
MGDERIIELLKEVKSNALALYSNFHVGAVLISKDDRLITGFNIESSSYGLTICAERVAVFKALSEGIREFKRIYIMSDGPVPCPPCGACRQVLMDFAPNIEVVMFSEEGNKKIFPLKDLLPFAFNDKNLNF